MNTNRKKILVVDDNPVIVETLSMKLASAGYQVLTALDGSEAITAARNEKPSLILLDLNFPNDIGMTWDGFGIIAWLQRIDEGSGRTPVIVISGGEASKYKERSLKAGAIAYFEKPVNNEELLTQIKKILSADAGKPAQA